MAQRFVAGDRVKLRVAKTFNIPPNLPVGSAGTVRRRLSTLDNYWIKFDIREKWVLVKDGDLEPE